MTFTMVKKVSDVEVVLKFLLASMTRWKASTFLVKLCRMVTSGTYDRWERTNERIPHVVRHKIDKDHILVISREYLSTASGLTLSTTRIIMMDSNVRLLSLYSVQQAYGFPISMPSIGCRIHHNLASRRFNILTQALSEGRK
jgi:hypothetical protein